MNIKTLSKPIFQGKKDQSRISSTTLGLSLAVAFFLVALTFVLGTKSLPKISARIEVEPSFADNPELMVARRYAASPERFLAANPEINLARRYASTLIESSEWVTNPELFYASRYSEVHVEAAYRAYLSANPELMITRSHTLTRLQSVSSESYSTNPELLIHHRYLEAQIAK